MNIERDQILDAVREGKGRLTKRDLVRTLGLSGDKRRELRYVLKSLLDDGLIIRDDRKQFRVADSLPNVMVLSVDHVDDQGDLIAMPLKWDGHDKPPPIRIVERKKHKKIMAQLGVGDKVLCRINKTQNGYRGDVIKKLARAGRQELGIIVKGGRGLRIRSVKKGSRQDFIPQKGTEVSDQDLVMFELSQTRHKGERIARVCEIIGKADGPHAASIISLYEANIPIGFSEDELAEARALTLPSIDKTREDLRDLPLVTIDPEDAKDFDDAIFARPDDTAKNEGGYIVWVAIADVSAYVLPGSALDKGAYKRGNSVYLPDRVVPMLPEEISADLCSLRPHEDRACLAVRMVFDAHGDKIAHTFKRGLMRSHARLTYAQAQEVFSGKSQKNINEAAKPVFDILTDIHAAYLIIKQARERRAPLEIDMPERRVHVDAKGKVTRIEVRDRFDAHKLVEEFMIQANVAAAQALERKTASLIYRVHDTPEREKLQGLADFLPALGLKWSLGERPTAKRFNRLIEMGRKKDLAETVSMSVLRSQMQAFYGPKNGGHFGLNLTHYAHFTSPIRRYADLIVHRALVRTFGLGEGRSSDEELSRLKEISEHISDTERRAMAAERNAKDRYVAAFLQDKIDAVFDARISGVTRAGLFLTLDETGADGFVPISRLGWERFIVDEKLKCLVGAETGSTYKFGMRVQAKLLEATPVSGGLLFEITSEPLKGDIPKHRAHNGSYRGKGRKHKSKNRRR